MPFNENHYNFQLLRETLAEHRAPVVFWIGAGASDDAKLPNWKKLRENLVAAALEELVSLPPAEADEKETKLELAATTEDLWQAFEDLQEILGHPSYKSIIRNNLSSSDLIPVPIVQQRIWKFEATRGVVSLNIDGLEGRAHSTVRGGEGIDTFVGRDLKNHLPTIKDKHPFIARLHGHHADASSWVFTKKELNKQVGEDSYRLCVQQIFGGYSVVFLGISADDVAAGGFLRSMTSSGVDAGNHFWITSRLDKVTRGWCRDAGIMHVPYTLEDGETHSSIIGNIFDNIEAYSSKDKPAEPVSYLGERSRTIPPLRELRVLDENEIREKLNSYAKHLLEEGANRTDTIMYQDFISNYSPAIHQSWHLDVQQGYNVFFEYTAIEKIHSGPFSNVWRVQDSNRNQFALKIMQIDNLRKGPQLDSFRRGISSQRLLRDSADFSGIAKIETAFEIPPSVIMEFIEGENLDEISNKPDFLFWESGLDISINICKIVSDAHKSKYGVLHRDIRPHNIMVPNYYYGDSAVDFNLNQNDVRILNYDMTWHKDASGRVIPVDPLSVGYFAPELLREPDSTRARDSRVDSYGIGMTIYKMASGRTPPLGGSSSTEWHSCLQRIRSHKTSWFESSHNHLSRIIEEATRESANDRPLVVDILVKLSKFRDALKNGIMSAELRFLAENLMFQTSGDDFESNAIGTKFTKKVIGYYNLEIMTSLKENKIEMFFNTSNTSTEDWSKASKAWSGKLSSARQILESGGWRVKNGSGYFERAIALGAEISGDDLRSRYEKARDTLARAIQRLQPS